MTTPSDSATQKLSMTWENRHQYFETALVSAYDSEHEMMRAEARGRRRRVREAALKRRLQNLGVGLLVMLVVAGAVGVAVWVSAR